MVSFWLHRFFYTTSRYSTATENRMVLGQTRTAAHSNEITAIPELLRVLELKGCLVTIDAMGCQRNIAQQVVQGG